MKISSAKSLLLKLQLVDLATCYNFGLNQSNIFTLEFFCGCINFFKNNLLDN